MEPTPSPRSAKTFTEGQSVSSRRLGFSVTKACPLKCAHCSVSAGPDMRHTTFTADFTERVVTQLPELKEVGVDFIDFTGGEPTLAAEFVERVSTAASEVGISSGIVTAAHWAETANSAARFINKFANISSWDISTDVYHLPFVSLATVERAFDALVTAGKNVLIRVAFHEPMTREDAELINDVHRFAGRRIGFQEIGPVGRGAAIFSYTPVDNEQWDRTPCPSTGPLVQSDGRVTPCCAPLSHEEYEHPLLIGDANRESLVDIVSRWRIHPLLQTLRVWGFEPVLRWYAEQGIEHLHVLRHRVCSLCVEIVRDRRLVDFAMEKSTELPHRIKLAIALQQYFGENWLDQALRQEAINLIALREKVDV